MDGRGGCCIARYAGGAYDTSKIDRIMLRFRPIAPKPAVGGSVSGGEASPEKNVNDVITGKTGRAKRKYVRDSNKKCSGRKKKVVTSAVSAACLEKRREVFLFDNSISSSNSSNNINNNNNNTTVVTLPLLPEKPVEKDTPITRSPPPSSSSDNIDHLTVGTAKPVVYVPVWLNSSKLVTVQDPAISVVSQAPAERTVLMPQPVRPVGSCVIVECVTEVCGAEDDIVGLGIGDEEKRTNLEKDACPGLISDSWDRVEWTNEAYRKMVNGDDDEDDAVRPEMVWLVMKEKLPPATCPAFACRVRVQYTCRKERYSLTVPCDVWRMDCGGLAWRLDVKAALSLGR